jgi:hypothetical protein
MFREEYLDGVIRGRTAWQDDAQRGLRVQSGDQKPQPGCILQGGQRLGAA